MTTGDRVPEMTHAELAPAFETVARRVVPGGSLVRHYPLAGGVSAAVHALEISSSSGDSRVVVRQQGASSFKQLEGDASETEFRLLGALHDHELPVPKPLLLDVTRELLPAPFLVMEHIEGSTTITEPFLDAALEQLASFLARLHTLELRMLALPRLPPREDPVRGTLEFLPDAPQWTRLRERLARLRPRTTEAVLLHGDYWPGNVLWAEESLATVLDWEDAALGPAASDVACCRAELNALFDASASARFTERYRAAGGRDLPDLHLWDVYVGLAALGTMHAWGLPAEVEARRRERTATFVRVAAEALLESH